MKLSSQFEFKVKEMDFKNSNHFENFFLTKSLPNLLIFLQTIETVIFPGNLFLFETVSFSTIFSFKKTIYHPLLKSLNAKNTAYFYF